MAQGFSPSFRTALLLGVAVCFGLSACNKLGYGEPRTAPEGMAALGPKRLPQLNGPELQKKQTAVAMQAQKGMQHPHAAMPMAAPMMAPTMPAQAPMPTPMAAPQPQQIAPQIPANYPVTPYSVSPQSYQMPPQQVPQPQAPASAQQSSYHLPYEFAPGSYYQAGMTPQNPHNVGLAQTVSVTDYYSQDIQQAPGGVTGASQEWYASAAPVGEVYGRPLPVGMPADAYHVGFGMDAAYGRYREPSLAAVPRDPSSYQPMTARQAAAYPSIDPYAEELQGSAYDNVYYGGSGMPRGQNRSFAPNFDAAAASGPFTNGFGQRASGMINPVSSNHYADMPMRRSLEEPPMLMRESMLPQPYSGAPADVYYGDGGYR